MASPISIFMALIVSFCAITIVMIHIINVTSGDISLYDGGTSYVIVVIQIISFILGWFTNGIGNSHNWIVSVVLITTISASLYAFLSEVLASFLGVYLTRARGEKWVKEIDYVYLGIAFVGLIFRLIYSSENESPGIYYVPPLLLSTAIVIRALKTRSEINGWNKGAA